MSNEPIVEKLIIRDQHSYGKDLKMIDVPLSKAIGIFDEYCENRNNKQNREIWTCRLGWHNFPDLKSDTICDGCKKSVAEVRRDKRRFVKVKNIILHIKMNVRRWRDEQLQRIKEIVDKEVDRRNLDRDDENAKRG